MGHRCPAVTELRDAGRPSAEASRRFAVEHYEDLAEGLCGIGYPRARRVPASPRSPTTPTASSRAVITRVPSSIW